MGDFGYLTTASSRHNCSPFDLLDVKLLLLCFFVFSLDDSIHPRFQPCHCSLLKSEIRNGQVSYPYIFPQDKQHSECCLKVSRKEVFQPHLPVRLPCYDLAPVTDFALGRASRRRTSSALGSHGLTGGVYKARERIHRAMADARLLANPASRSRVADSDPN